MKKQPPINLLDQLHNNLTNKSELYSDWHNHPHQHRVQMVILVMTVMIFGGLFFLRDRVLQQDRYLTSLQSQAGNESVWVEREAKLQTMTKDLLNLAQDYRKASAEEKPDLLVQLVELAKQRYAGVEIAAEGNPGVLLRTAISANLRNRLPAEVGKYLEEEISSKDGEFKWLIADSATDSRKYLSLTDSRNKEFELKFSEGSEYPKAVSGARIRVKGFQVGNKLVVSKAAGSVKVLAATSPQQIKKVAVILLNFQNNNSQPFSTEQVRSSVFTGNPSVNHYYQETSFGNLRLGGHLRPDGDVFGWYTLPTTWTDPNGVTWDFSSNTGCDSNGKYYWWGQVAEQLAAANGFVSSNYTNVVYAFPQSDCYWQGVAYLGGTQAWINGTGFDISIVTHELGHNFSRNHAITMNCIDSAGVRVSISDTCNLSLYGDFFDVMSNHHPMRHMSGLYKGLISLTSQSWWSSTNVKTLDRQANPSGVYTLLPLEINTSGLQVLRIPKSQQITSSVVAGYYYLDFRQPIGYDNGPTSNPYFNGVGIHFGMDFNTSQGNYYSFLIDTTPATPSFDDAPLGLGQTFYDPIANITVTLESYSSAGANVRVTLGQLPCQAASPTLSLTPSSSTVTAGQTISYTMTLRSNDSASCASNAYTITPTLPAGWTQTPASFNETLAPGASVTRTFLVTTNPADPTPQTSITETAVRAGTTNLSGQAQATVYLAIPDTTPPTVTITTPADNGAVKSKGKLNISASATDNVRVISLKLFIDATLVKTCSTPTCAGSTSLNALASGSHQVKAVATDNSGNVATKIRLIIKP